MQPQDPSRAHLGVVVRAAAYAVDPAGKSPPMLIFSEHNSTVVFRTGPLRLFTNASAYSSLATKKMQNGTATAVSITEVPIYWGRSSPFYRRVPSINTTYQGHPFARFGTGNLTLRGTKPSPSSAPTPFTRGLGFWA